MKLQKASTLGNAGLSIGGEAIPFTMQAEFERKTLDEAMASGLFDLPDEPGMVRLPVILEATIPHYILYPPAPSPGLDTDDSRHGLPGSGTRRRRTRFGNYPRVVAALNIARTFQTPAAARSESDAFRDMLAAVRTGRGAPVAARPVAGRMWSNGPQAGTALRTPDATPVRRAGAEEEEMRLGPDGRELSPVKAARGDMFDSAARQLRKLGPRTQG